MKKLNVLSLFGGMECGRIALDELGFECGIYYYSEIDKFASKQVELNFPDIIHLGDVEKWREWDIDWSSLDLVIGGSPCQGFSFAGNRKGMQTKDGVEILSLDDYLELKESRFEFTGQSYLFWEYVRLMKEINPTRFLLENVKMSKKWRSVFDSIMGVDSIYINSSLVTFATRPRLYWTNIVGSDFNINDRGVLLNNNIDLSQEWRDVIPTFYKKWGDKNRIDKGVNWVGSDKLNCLTTKLCHTNQYLFNDDYSKMRMLTIDEARRMQTIPDWYKYDVISKTAFEKCLGNGWTVEVIKEIFSYL